MKNPFFWLSAVVVILLWSAYELYPPNSRPLLEQFEHEAENTQDPTFRSILTQARALSAQAPARAFENLLSAASTNSLERYFPKVEIPAGKDTNRVILNKLQRDAMGQIKLGLDLQGGMSFLVQMETNQFKDSSALERALDQAVEILRKRVDRFGVAEPVIQKSGEDRIEIQMPGLTEAEREAVTNTIQKAAFLEFRMVHPESARLLQEGLIPPGFEILNEIIKDRKSGQEQVIPLLVKKKAEDGLTGAYVTRADAVPDPVTGEPKIEFEFNSEGARIFADLTRKYSPKPGANGTQYSYLAIVLDGVLYSAPRINEEIPGGRGVISGNFDMKDAFELANVLMNPLEAPVKIIEESRVEPTLGSDSINSGIRATVIGTLLVVGFMLGYYLFAGAVANVALLLNIFILLGVLCAVDATLTLPGIAGILLTAGMAVDANVLIYERIREERAAGKSLRGAIAAGYGKAFWTIFDSNLTTLISAVIMIWLGTGPVKGFGVTLTIGICASMFTALVVTRMVFDLFLHKGWLKNLRMMSLIRPTRLDFMRLALPAFILSWSLILIGIGYGIYRGKDVLGVDFAGGDSITYSYQQRLPLKDLRSTLEKAGIADPQIIPKASVGGGLETIQIVTPFGEGGKVQGALSKAFPQAGLKLMGVERKGPAVGAEIQLSALKSMLLALFGILVYVAFRYEFSFSIGAVVAILHDILMTLGWFFLTDRQLSAPMVAAILTIIGFSINDTIVIFDRIREDLTLGVKGSFRDLLNLAINQTLSRTIITSGTVFIATASLYVFGGSVINDFAFTFLVGILTGTYSTIYIASAIVLWWHKGQRPVIGPVQTVSAPQVQQPARA